MSSAPVRRHAAAIASAVRLRDRPHAAFALDRLDDDGGRVGRDRRGDAPRDRRGSTKVTPGTSGCERGAVVLVPRHRQRAHRPAVERVGEGDEVRCAASPCVCQKRRANFRHASTASAPLLQKNARGRPDSCRQPRRQLPLQRVVEQVRRVQQRRAPASAIARASAGMRVAERGDADAGDQVEIALARRASNSAQPSPRLEHDRRAPVDLQHVLRVESDRIVEVVVIIVGDLRRE